MAEGQRRGRTLGFPTANLEEIGEAIPAFGVYAVRVSDATFAWSFGTLDDRSPAHVATVWIGLLLAAAVVPFVAWELDLFQAGEDDAR